MQEYVIAPDDERFALEGAVSVERRSDACVPWRVPVEEWEFYYGIAGEPGLNSIAEQPAGVRLTFSTNAPYITLLVSSAVAGQQVDLVLNGGEPETFFFGENERELTIPLPGEGFKRLALWPDHRHFFSFAGMRIPNGFEIRRAKEDGLRWVHYGSSISHSTQAQSPARTWNALVARKTGLSLQSLGYNGNCMLETMAARLIRDLPADVITLKVGINVHNGRLNERTYRPAAIGLVRLIREKHPNTPIALISPIYSPDRETTRAWEQGMTLVEMRQALREVAELLRRHGDENLVFFDGLSLFGPEQAAYLPDRLHPDAEGQAVLADRFLREMELNLLFRPFFAAKD